MQGVEKKEKKTVRVRLKPRTRSRFRGIPRFGPESGLEFVSVRVRVFMETKVVGFLLEDIVVEVVSLSMQILPGES